MSIVSDHDLVKCKIKNKMGKKITSFKNRKYKNIDGDLSVFLMKNAFEKFSDTQDMHEKVGYLNYIPLNNSNTLAPPRKMKE